jgi:SAM-dependent methyltransferase
MSIDYRPAVDKAIYLNERRYDTPKEMFKEAAAILGLSEPSTVKPSVSLIDIGAATGEFAYFVRAINPEVALYCVEYNAELVEYCRTYLAAHNIDITCGDINNLTDIPDSQFDFATSFGVTHIFDDFAPSLNEMIRVTRDGGTCLNVILLNELPIDLLIRYRIAGSNEARAGWNKFAIASVAAFLDGHPYVASYRFVKHEMPFDIAMRDDNLMRSWTVLTPEGRRILWNGMNMEISLYHVVFTISKTAK